MVWYREINYNINSIWEQPWSRGYRARVSGRIPSKGHWWCQEEHPVPHIMIESSVRFKNLFHQGFSQG